MENKTQNPKNLPKEIDFTTKPTPLKSLPPQGEETSHGFIPFMKKAGSGLGRTMCLPISAAVITTCGFLAFLAFLFKIPVAAFLETIGLKETSKKLLSDEEVGFLWNVTKKVWEQGVMKIPQDFGAASRAFMEAGPRSILDGISHSEELITSESAALNNNRNPFGRKNILPESSPYDPNGNQLLNSSKEKVR